MQCFLRRCSAFDDAVDVCITTYGAYDATTFQSSSVSCIEAGLWGIARSARLEVPHISVRCVDLQGKSSGQVISTVLNKTETEILLNGHQWLAPRLQKLQLIPYDNSAHA